MQSNGSENSSNRGPDGSSVENYDDVSDLVDQMHQVVKLLHEQKVRMSYCNLFIETIFSRALPLIYISLVYGYLVLV